MKNWIGGAIAVVLALSPIALLTAAGLIIAMIAGLFAVMAGGMGAAAIHQSNENANGICTANGGTGVPTTATQQEYVRTMIGIAKTMGVSEQGQIIAVMVMLQESGIQNYANTGENKFGYDIGSGTGQSTEWWLETAKLSLEYPHDAQGRDADSVGLFQQRASSGWGDGGGYNASASSDHGRTAIERLLDPKWGAQAFFGGPGGPASRGLLDVSGWESMSLTVAAQTVQGSAFPAAYAKWESQAREMVSQNRNAPAIPLVGDSGGAPDKAKDSKAKTQLVMPMQDGTYSITDGYGPRVAPTAGASTWHRGVDFGAPLGTPLYAVADGVVADIGYADGFGHWLVIDHMIDGEKYSTVYGHINPSYDKVTNGQKVTAGQHVAGVGTEGTSTGPHLHFEVWRGGRLPSGTGQHLDPIPWLEGSYSVGGAGAGCSNSGGSSAAAADTSTTGSTQAGPAINDTSTVGSALVLGIAPLLLTSAPGRTTSPLWRRSRMLHGPRERDHTHPPRAPRALPKARREPGDRGGASPHGRRGERAREA